MSKLNPKTGRQLLESLHAPKRKLVLFKPKITKKLQFPRSGWR